MTDRLRSLMRRTVGATKLVVLGCLAFLALSATGPSTTTWQAAAPAPDTTRSTEVAQLIQRHDCSTSGLNDDVIPGSALVRRGGDVHLVSFDEGWATLTGAADGTLVAVCP